MSFGNVPVAFECQSIQKSLDSYFADNLIPYKRAKDNAFIRFLKSQPNRQGVIQIQDDATNAFGQKLKVRMRTRDNLCLALVKQSWTCDQAVFLKNAVPKEHLFDLDDTPYTLKDPTDATSKPLVFKWDFNEYKRLCINQPEFFQETIARGLVQLEELVNKDLMTVLATKLGKQQTSAGTAVASKPVPLFLASTQTAVPVQNPFVTAKIQEAYNLSRTTGRYSVFGGTRFWNYAQASNISTASAWGFDISKTVQPYDFMYDLDYDSVFGAASFISIPYGGVQLVQWNANVGDGFIDFPHSKKFTVSTPNGLRVDMFWEHFTGNMCNEIRVGLSTYAELAVVPSGGCFVDNDVNGLFKFTDCSLTTDIACPA